MGDKLSPLCSIVKAAGCTHLLAIGPRSYGHFQASLLTCMQKIKHSCQTDKMCFDFTDLLGHGFSIHVKERQEVE